MVGTYIRHISNSIDSSIDVLAGPLFRLYTELPTQGDYQDVWPILESAIQNSSITAILVLLFVFLARSLFKNSGMVQLNERKISSVGILALGVVHLILATNIDNLYVTIGNVISLFPVHEQYLVQITTFPEFGSTIIILMFKICLLILFAIAGAFGTLRMTMFFLYVPFSPLLLSVEYLDRLVPQFTPVSDKVSQFNTRSMALFFSVVSVQIILSVGSHLVAGYAPKSGFGTILAVLFFVVSFATLPKFFSIYIKMAEVGREGPWSLEKENMWPTSEWFGWKIN